MTGGLSLRARALHWVFKIGDREATINFYRSVLGMKVLRHEEFEEGCKATCNGPYDGKWSKTMIGYGAEDNHFVAELTYNYGVDKYKLGNDFLGFVVSDPEILVRAEQAKLSVEEQNGTHVIKSPDGYPFIVSTHDRPEKSDVARGVIIGCKSLARSLAFWKDLIGMHSEMEDSKRAVLRFSPDQASLELRELGVDIDHGTAFGRIAFSVPSAQLKGIEEKMKETNNTILTPYTRLDTPGKATVEVVILADPDGHEICFVGDEAFRELSQMDPNGDKLLNKAMEADKSKEWFAKKGREKETA